jgi:XTP/dITP diphosphohydrolase
MLTFLIASNNTHKHQELREIFALHGLADTDVKLIMPRDVGISIDPEENAVTYAGNALIKARAFAAERNRQPDWWVLADDSGLEVDALAGRPGLLSARYHKAAPNGDGCTELLRELIGVPSTQRQARFRAVLALIDTTEHARLFEGVCEGSIGDRQRGMGGFGFDPVFAVADDPAGRHMAELPSIEKHRISHRGLAMARLIAHL